MVFGKSIILLCIFLSVMIHIFLETCYLLLVLRFLIINVTKCKLQNTKYRVCVSWVSLYVFEN